MPDQKCETFYDHDFVEISQENLGPTDEIMKMNGDCLFVITQQCKICGEINVYKDV